MVTLRQSSLAVARRNAGIVNKIKTIKQRHPFWGYRRIWAYLNYHDGLSINKKRVYRLMREHQLLVKDHRLLKAKRQSYPSKPKATAPNQIWGTDMTKVKLPHTGWAYIVLVLDWHTKKIVGHGIACRSKTDDWLDALNDACNKQCPLGIQSYHSVSLVSDNGCQPTSARYMEACQLLGITQIFTSFNNPKGNAETERMMRTMKEELIWSNDFQSFEQLKCAINRWVEEYNRNYCHSAIGYKPPCVFEKLWLEQPSNSPLMAA